MANYAPVVPRYVTRNDDEDDQDTIILELSPADPQDWEELPQRVAMAYQIWDNIDPPDGLDSERVISGMQAKCNQNSLVLSPLFTQMCRISSCNICYEVYDDGPHYPMVMDPCKHAMCYSCCRRIMGDAVDNCPVCRTLPVNIVKVQTTASVMRALLEEEEKNLELQLKKKENPGIVEVFKNFLLNRLELARCQQMGFLETACNAAKEEFKLRTEVRSGLVREEFDRLSEEIAVSFERLSGMDNASLLREAQEILKRIGAKNFFHKSIPDILPSFNEANAIMNRMVQGSLLDNATAIATREKYMDSEESEVFNLHHFSPTSTRSLSELPEGVVHRIVQNIYSLNRTASRKVKRNNARHPARPKPARSR